MAARLAVGVLAIAGIATACGTAGVDSGGLPATPAVDLGNRPATLWAVDGLTGEILWSVEIPDPHPLRQDIAYPEGVGVQGAGPDRLVIEEIDKTLVFATRDPVGTVGVSVASGRIAWQVATDWGWVGAWWVETGQIALVVTDIFWRDQNPREPRLLRIDPADGSILSSEGFPGLVDSPPFDVIVESRPNRGTIELASASGVAYLAEAPEGMVEGRGTLGGHGPLTAVDLATGEVRWTMPFTDSWLTGAVVSEVLYVVSEPGRRRAG